MTLRAQAVLIALISVSCSSQLRGAEPASSRPVLVLDVDASGPFTAQQYPRFLLYEDNTVFVSRGINRFRIGRITSAAASSLRARAERALGKLPRSLKLSPWNHEPTTTIAVRTTLGWRASSVYGLEPFHLHGRVSSCAPPVFVSLYKLLGGFELEAWRRWVPSEIEINLYEDDHPGTAISKWPKDLPRPTVVPTASDSYFSFRRPIAERPSYWQLKSGRVKLADRNWSISSIEVVLVGEASIELARSGKPAVVGCPTDPTPREMFERRR